MTIDIVEKRSIRRRVHAFFFNKLFSHVCTQFYVCSESFLMFAFFFWLHLDWSFFFIKINSLWEIGSNTKWLFYARTIDTHISEYEHNYTTYSIEKRKAVKRTGFRVSKCMHAHLYIYASIQAYSAHPTKYFCILKMYAKFATGA